MNSVNFSFPRASVLSGHVPEYSDKASFVLLYKTGIFREE